MSTRVTGRSHARGRAAAKLRERHPERTASEDVQILISTVEDLVGQLGMTVDPELKRLRAQTEAALSSAKDALAERSAQLRDRAQDVAQDLAEQAEGYVRERPWVSIGLLALSAVAIGMWTGRAVFDRSRS